jgi:hypothetical protein
MDDSFHVFENVTEEADRTLEFLGTALHFLSGAVVQFFPFVLHAVPVNFNGIVLRERSG